METLRPNSSSQRKSGRWLWRGALLALLLWIGMDLFVPRQHSIRQFDPLAVARLETAMWRSYYEKKPTLLFWQLAGGLRQQFHAPFWRSFKLAFQATKAAFAFKKGKSRVDYQQVLPDLIAYYESIQALSTEPFDVPTLAKLELEWWIIHRQRDQYSYKTLANALAQTAATQYTQPITTFVPYSQLRADAMRLCDAFGKKSGGATEADWQQIEQELNRAWSSLHKAVSVTNSGGKSA